MKRYLPDAFLFAVLLTFLVFLLGITLTPSGPLEMISFWGDGLWNLLKFSMEMTLILVTGHALANTAPIKFCLDKLASLAKNQARAVLLTTLVSSLACWVNWGFGLIVSALFALELAKRIKQLNFALILASSYSGFLVWHSGLSGSIPLKLTSPSIDIQEIIGESSLALSETVFSSFNLVLLLVNIFCIFGINFWLSQVEKKHSHDSDFDLAEAKPSSLTKADNSFAAQLENSKLLVIVFCSFAFIYLIQYFFAGKSLNLGTVSFVFLFLGYLFSQTTRNYLKLFKDAVTQSSGIILQFPLYAGLMAMMKSSGLSQMMTQLFLDFSSADSFLFFTYLSAGLLNFFVPSGGGQWAIQAPIILPAAKELGVDFSKASMAIAWGDAWSNMIQPFWALPLLSLTGVKLQEMMSYTVIIFIGSGVVTGLFLLLN